MSFTFKGIQRPYILSANIQKSFSHSDSIVYTEIEDRPGALVEKRSVGIRTIVAEVWVDAGQFLSVEDIEEDMASWLWTTQPEELFFDSRPDRKYMAIAKVTGKPIEYAHSAMLVITFTCTESYKRGMEVTENFNSGVAVVRNLGTVPTAPIIELDVTGDVTHVDVMTEDGFLRIGEAASLEEVIFEPLTKVSELPLTNTVGWSVVSSLDHGHVGGTMGATTPRGFRPTLYGPANLPHDWQGPALRYSPPDPIQDFRFDLDVELLNEASRSGMIELFGLDTLNRVVFVLGVEDISQTQALVQGKFLVGGKTNRLHEFIAKPDATSPRAWNNYKGVLRIHRRGNRITPYWALVNSKGNHVWKYSRHSYVDSLNRNMAPVSQLIIAMRKWPTTPEALMAARNLRAFRYNNEPEGIPVIAKAGDKFVIDMEKSLVTLNGEDFEEVAFGSEFFDIPTGTSALVVEPSDKLTGNVTFKERYR